MGRRHHVLDVYDAELHLATTEREWARLVRRFEGTLEPDDCNGVGTTTLVLDRERFRPHLVIWVDLTTHGDDALGLVTTCAHEAAHAAGMLLDHIRQSYDGESEAFAYLVGWITRWLIEGIDWKH
jgi:hypothetical protein